MGMYKDILICALSQNTAKISFENLETSDPAQIVEMVCYKATQRIRQILDDDSLSDFQCIEVLPQNGSPFILADYSPPLCVKILANTRSIRSVFSLIGEKSSANPNGTSFWGRTIEEIVCVFEGIGSGGGSRHDFG